MDAAINELMYRKTVSAFSKNIHCGIDELIRIEQQKGFPDLIADVIPYQEKCSKFQASLD